MSIAYKILNTSQPSHLYDLVSIQTHHGHKLTTHALHLMSLWSNHHHHSKSLTATSDMLHLIYGPASYITQDSSSKLFIPLSATFIWTCQFNLLHTAITFHHFFTVSLRAQNLPFQKILSSTLACFCLLDWSHGSRLRTGLICSSVLCFSSICSVLSYSYVWQTKLASSLVNFWVLIDWSMI